jgi:hypothetical protein
LLKSSSYGHGYRNFFNFANYARDLIYLLNLLYTIKQQ